MRRLDYHVADGGQKVPRSTMQRAREIFRDNPELEKVEILHGNIWDRKVPTLYIIKRREALPRELRPRELAR